MNMYLIRHAAGDDITYLAPYLASDASSWATGRNLRIDGGVFAGCR